MAGDVLIVARPYDGVARRLRAALSARGRQATWLDGPEIARLFTVRVGATATTVTPDVPIFVRPAPWWAPETEADADARFLRNECYATFWAAAALCDAPVINRPTLEGPVYRVTSGALTLEAGSGPEILTSSRTQIEDDDGTYWGETLDYRAGPLARMPAEEPVRARRVDVAAGYEIVTVVGAETFVATRDPRSEVHALAARSLALTRSADVLFATVAWAVTDTAAVPVRLNPTPDESELRYRQADVLDALCRELLA